MRIKKVVVLVFWVILASSFLLPDDSTGGRIGRIAFGVTLAAHFVEYFIYRPTLQKAEGSLAHHFWQVMIFGMFHFEEVEAELSQGGS